MGLIVDTTVFIGFERRGQAIDLSPWEPSEDVFISAVTVSELLMGVHPSAALRPLASERRFQPSGQLR